jgi:hypothetical protein
MDWRHPWIWRCPWIWGIHRFGNIIIIKGDNISVHYKPPPIKDESAVLKRGRWYSHTSVGEKKTKHT